MDLVALSPHEPLAERIDALRESKNKQTARKLCKDETCPSQLRQEALLLLDGSDQDDLFCAFASCVPTLAQDTRDIALKVAQNLQRPNVLNELQARLATEPDRFELLALWGFCTWAANHSTNRSLIPLQLIDLLSSIAGEEFLRDSIGRNELMGSFRTEALAVLGLRTLSICLTVEGLREALEGFARVPRRAAALNVLLKDFSLESGNQAFLVILALCEALEHSVLNDDTLKRWNEQWFFGASPSTDESARTTERYAKAFGNEAFPLIICLKRWVNEYINAGTDPAIATRVIFVLNAWATDRADEGIVLPWVTTDCSLIANESINHIFAELGQQNIQFDCEELRQRLASDAWRTDWPATGALLRVCIKYLGPGMLIKGEDHLLPTLLPLADDVDPRISGAAWSAISSSLSIFAVRDAPILFRALERSLSVQDPATYHLVTSCLNVVLQKYDQNSLSEYDLFIERISRDIYYSAGSHPVLYRMAVENCLCTAIEFSGLFAIRLFPTILIAIQSGSQKRVTTEASLQLLESLLIACKPRIRAHRGEIFVILLRQSVFAGNNTIFKRCLQRFRSILKEADQLWLEAQIAKVKKASPELGERFSETL